MESADNPSQAAGSIESATNADTPSRRRWLTFSLAGLLTFMAVACLGFAWFGFHWRAKQRERAAVNALEKRSGFIFYDYQLDQDGMVLESLPDPPGPAWLRFLLGDDWFAEVEYVAFFQVFATGGGPKHFRQYSEPNIPITDTDLLFLREFTQLQSLTLAYTP